jgi:hypothetical protein
MLLNAARWTGGHADTAKLKEVTFKMKSAVVRQTIYSPIIIRICGVTFWAPSARTVTLAKIPPIQLHLG